MLEGRNLTYRYGAGDKPVFRDLSIAVEPGKITGLTGVSGLGKSTLARVISGHLPVQEGQVLIDGIKHKPTGLNPVQLLAQSPIFAVNPRWTVGRIISEAWKPDDATRSALRVRAEWYERYPHQLSGGELQRVTVLRALAPSVRYLIADEISSALDPITQAEIWEFLTEYARRNEIGILAISHDRALLDWIADSTIEMT